MSAEAPKKKRRSEILAEEREKEYCVQDLISQGGADLTGDKICALMQQHPQIESLDFDRYSHPWDTPRCIAACESLRHNTTIKYLHLHIWPRLQAEQSPVIQALAASLRENVTLHCLRVEFAFTEEVVTLLSDAVRNKPLLDDVRLYLPSPPFEDKDKRDPEGGRRAGQLAASILRFNPNVRQLGIIRQFDARGCAPLADALRHAQRLTHLELICVTIGDEGCRLLTDALMRNTTITELNLRGCGMKAQSGVYLADLLKVNKTITHLELEGNNLKKAGGCALADALAVNCTLKTLNLKSCKLMPSAVCKMARALRKNSRSALRWIDLQDNQLGSCIRPRVDVSTELIATLAFNPQLHTVSVWSLNSFSNTATVPIKDVLPFIPDDLLVLILQYGLTTDDF